MKTYLWYISPTQRFIAQGNHQQEAFLNLSADHRNSVPHAEFCMEVDVTKNQHKAPYVQLLKIREDQRSTT